LPAAATAAIVMDSRYPLYIPRLTYALRRPRHCSLHVATSVVCCTSSTVTSHTGLPENTLSTATFVRCRRHARPGGISWTGDEPRNDGNGVTPLKNQ